MEPTLKNLLSYALTYFSLLFHGPKIHPFHYQLLAPSSPEILNQDVFSDKFESTVVLMNATIYPDTLKKDQTQEQMSEKLRKLFEEEVLMWKAKTGNRTEDIVFMPVITVNKTKFDTEQLLQQIRADYNTVKAFVRQFLEESRKHKIPVSNVIISIYGWNNECGIKGMESCRQREIMTRKIFNDLEIKTQRANGTIYFVGDQLWNDISLRTLIHLKGGNDPSTVI
ncbi:unnamed protein product [Bursaphelenchus xylophilus]|uniref:(pine wood nematode) hypothetical protein n=1 Tax=Bursaphelenchus xylophilus TaxID=6326 RepID=A0A1I7RN34_BURXY|nr:unnamed protein product [Bursaphelenchus xylophilus]CAG9087646.1 unnamed protein product [Bursaphelenchus xylophilus]